MFLWLWCRPAAVALIRPLEWELPKTAPAALKKKKKKRIKRKKKNLKLTSDKHIEKLSKLKGKKKIILSSKKKLRKKGKANIVYYIT